MKLDQDTYGESVQYSAGLFFSFKILNFALRWEYPKEFHKEGDVRPEWGCGKLAIKPEQHHSSILCLSFQHGQSD